MISKYSQFSEERKERMREAHKKWASKNSRKEYYSKYDKARNSPEFLMWRNAKSRAAKKGVAFDISVEDIHITNNCPVCGVRMKVGGKGGSHCSPSLDRVVPNKGYVSGNVKVICKSCNSVKSDATLEQLRNIIDYIEKNS